MITLVDAIAALLPYANSTMFVLPRITAPTVSKRRTTSASRSGVEHTSFRPLFSRPRYRTDPSTRSERRAADRASVPAVFLPPRCGRARARRRLVVTAMNAFSVGFSRSMR